MTITVNENDIQRAFSTVGLTKVEKEIINKCVGLAKSLCLSAEEMADCWAVFGSNKNIPALDDTCYQAFRSELVKKSSAAPLSHNSGAVVTKTRTSLPNHVTPDSKRLRSSAPTEEISPRHSIAPQIKTEDFSLSPGPFPRSTKEESGASVTSKAKYTERKGAGSVVATYRPTRPLPSITLRTSPSNPCKIDYQLFETNLLKPCRYLFTTADERCKALDENFEELRQAMIARYNFGVEDEGDAAPLEAVGIPRQDKICCIGRICNSAHQGRINETSIVLHESRGANHNARVQLDLSHLKKQSSFSLFPGQIVAVEGMNTGGTKMLAHAICDGCAPEPLRSTVKDLLHYHYEQQEGQALRMFAVAGPYTTSDNLHYEPLIDFLKVVSKDEPDVVVMTGPFVDFSHDAVQAGQTTVHEESFGEDIVVPYETFFLYKIAQALESFYMEKKATKTQFVIIPSLNDAVAEWVYPQPPLRDRMEEGKESKVPGGEELEIGKLGLNEEFLQGRVHCLPNPCTFKINDVVVGVTSHDVLFDLSCDETNANLEPGSRMLRLAQHMVQQRSYYPLFPSSKSINVDLKFMDQIKMPCRPDILITPSKLAYLAKPLLDSSLAINPGRLTRDTTGGTYASILVHPIERNILEHAGSDGVELLHSVADRSVVEVKKI